MKIICKFLRQVKIGSFAVVYLDIKLSEKTVIEFGEERYDNNVSQGSIIMLPSINSNFDDWLEGARIGVKYGLTKSNKDYHITIEKIEGLSTDTNPLIISVATITGIWDFLNYLPTDEEREKIEKWAFDSWTIFKDNYPNELIDI